MKKSHRGFFLSTLEKLAKECQEGYNVVMNISPRFICDIPLIEIGYKYRPQKAIGFIATWGYGSTETGVIYLSCYPDFF